MPKIDGTGPYTLVRTLLLSFPSCQVLHDVTFAITTVSGKHGNIIISLRALFYVWLHGWHFHGRLSFTISSITWHFLVSTAPPGSYKSTTQDDNQDCRQRRVENKHEQSIMTFTNRTRGNAPAMVGPKYLHHCELRFSFLLDFFHVSSNIDQVSSCLASFYRLYSASLNH